MIAECNFNSAILVLLESDLKQLKASTGRNRNED
jgi:hypothetical protein